MQSKIVLPNPVAMLQRRLSRPQSGETQFPNSTQMSHPLPLWMWHVIRVIAVGLALGITIGLVARPDVALSLLWKGIVPLLPFLFFAAPGFWRNACPLAAVNQTPRLFNLSLNLEPPAWFKRYNYLIAIGLFLLIVPARKLLYNSNGPALALLISGILATAFLMGVLFKGKSGWCSSICPLLPVQRVYGQTPFVAIPNNHCQPCVGCTKNCYDFSPHSAYLADMYDQDRLFSKLRRFFVALFPGFILAFYLLPDNLPAWQMYGSFALVCMASLGSFFLVDTLTPLTTHRVAVLYGATALNLYYWFNAITLASWFDGPAETGIMWGVRALVFGLTLIWIYRSFHKEPIFIELKLADGDPLPLSQVHLPATTTFPIATPSTETTTPTVTFDPENKAVPTQKGRTLLDVAEANNMEIEAGCRMGVCGADPICVVKGMKNLSKMKQDERNTVERLGLGENTRMACMARVNGDVTVCLKPDAPKQFTSSVVDSFDYDATVKRVVIIGNGIAGVTAADHVRRRHPACEIELIGREPHHLYNRMAITRLIYGRSAMQGLYLQPEKWYTDLKINSWLNTQVTRVDPQTQQVYLGTGDTLSYDRLILTTGGESFLPPIEGYGQPGTFVLRTAEDAMTIRRFVQTHQAEQAVVAGGGLLGLEAAYALHKLNVKVTVLERSNALLRRQLDETGAVFLQNYLEQLGLTIIIEAEADSVQSHPDSARIGHVTLKDGRTLRSDVLLVCAGVRAEATLAHEMGLAVNRGIVVDEQMQTNLPHVYAAGDAAEFNGKTPGLWAVAVSQAETAAINAVGGQQPYQEVVPVTMLKVVGIDVTSIGQFEAELEDETIIFTDEAAHRYRKLVVREGRIMGAILIGYPDEAQAVAEVVKQELDVAAHLKSLRTGNWAVLTEMVE